MSKPAPDLRPLKTRDRNKSGLTYLYLVKGKGHNRYYNIQEIIKFPTCTITTPALRKRLNAFVNGETDFKTMLEAIEAPRGDPGYPKPKPPLTVPTQKDTLNINTLWKPTKHE